MRQERNSRRGGVGGEVVFLRGAYVRFPWHVLIVPCPSGDEKAEGTSSLREHNYAFERDLALLNPASSKEGQRAFAQGPKALLRKGEVRGADDVVVTDVGAGTVEELLLEDRVVTWAEPWAVDVDVLVAKFPTPHHEGVATLVGREV